MCISCGLNYARNNLCDFVKDADFAGIQQMFLVCFINKVSIIKRIVYEHVYMRPKVNSNRLEMLFRLHGNLHIDFTAASFQTIARLYCTCANDIF